MAIRHNPMKEPVWDGKKLKYKTPLDEYDEGWSRGFVSGLVFGSIFVAVVAAIVVFIFKVT